MTQGVGVTVLAVDDEPDIREVVRRVLSRRGYTVLLAGDAGEALRLAGEHSEQIRLLLTDVRMPDGSGAALAARLRRLVPDLPVLFMSGLLADEVLTEDAVPGATVVEKPFTPSVLTEAVQTALAGPGASRPGG
jgi:CheY-like chemotaxis protein